MIRPAQPVGAHRAGAVGGDAFLLITILRGRAYDVAAHQQAVLPEQLLPYQGADAAAVPDRPGSGSRSG
ncbi:hypothetical protein ACIO8F_38465 [Streptomyces sp. NPDC087228]|uniref:hypothetical protein n=1 Tax=unclassified Streptomyces TaxID=2593676 RepID=UPI003802A091